MKKFMVIFGILAMIWFQSCQTPYNNIDLENENGNTVTEQTNGENQNDNGNNENPSTNEDSNSEENGQDENQQAEHVCKDYFEIEVDEDWTAFEYIARDVGEVAYHNCNRIWSNYQLKGDDLNRIYIYDDSESVHIRFALELNDNEDKILITPQTNNYKIYDVIRNGNSIEIQFIGYENY